MAARINVGAAIGAGFGLIARRPVSVLAWGLAPILLQVAELWVLAPYFLSDLSQIAQTASAGAPPPALADPMRALQMQALSQLFNLIALALGAIVYCAVWRAVLQPAKKSFASMRVGMPELFIALLSFGFGIALVVAMFVVMVPALLVIGIVGGVSQNPAIGFAVALPVALAVFLIGGAYLALRFAFVGPMMVADSKFHLFDSWSATRGHVGSLFLVGLGVVGVVLVVELVVMTVIVGAGAAFVISSGDPSKLGQTLLRSPGAALTALWPYAAAALALLVPITGVLTAIGAAPWARAYQDLLPDQSEVFA